MASTRPPTACSCCSTPSDDLSLLFNVHGRDNDGTASVFRANVLGPGSDDFNSNYDRDTVSFDEGDNNPQEAKGLGGSMRVDWDLGETVTLTSITAYEQTDDRSLGDIDGGFGADFLPFVGPCPPGTTPPPCIPFPSQTQDAIDNLDQLTQEIRLASQASDRMFWQAGVFYFDSEFSVTTTPFFVPPTTVVHENTAWAAFGNLSYDVTDELTLTGGLRYTDDEKDPQRIQRTGAGRAGIGVRRQRELGLQRALQHQRRRQHLRTARQAASGRRPSRAATSRSSASPRSRTRRRSPPSRAASSPS